MNVSLNRALWSAGIWAGTAYTLSMLLGANVSLTDALMDGGVMGGSSLASDYVHGAIGVQPTGLTSAAMTGAIFTGAQAARGSRAYTSNFLAAAGNDYLTEWMGNMMMSRMEAMDEK